MTKPWPNYCAALVAANAFGLHSWHCGSGASERGRSAAA
jgi:hypothetical protein